eukprot:3439884-Rhodomonas_salina.1
MCRSELGGGTASARQPLLSQAQALELGEPTLRNQRPEIEPSRAVYRCEVAVKFKFRLAAVQHRV